MKNKDIEIGEVYLAKISGRLAPVKILSVSQYNSRHWIAKNLRTKRQVVIRSGQKLRTRLIAFYDKGIRKWRAAK